MKIVPGGIIGLWPRKPRIRLFRFNNGRRAWECGDGLNWTGVGDTPELAYQDFNTSRSASPRIGRAPDFPQAARSHAEPALGSCAAETSAEEKLKPFSNEYVFIAGTWLGFVGGLLFAWLVSR